MKKILIIDDSLTARELVLDYCQSLGDFSYLEAEDGEEALDILKEEDSIELIICDQNMPNMKGLELLKTLTEDEKLKNIPFIFATSENDDDVIVEALGLGAKDYITKPLDKETFIIKIKRFLS